MRKSTTWAPALPARRARPASASVTSAARAWDGECLPWLTCYWSGRCRTAPDTAQTSLFLACIRRGGKERGYCSQLMEKRLAPGARKEHEQLRCCRGRYSHGSCSSRFEAKILLRDCGSGNIRNVLKPRHKSITQRTKFPHTCTRASTCIIYPILADTCNSQNVSFRKRAPQLCAAWRRTIKHGIL